MFEQVRCQTVIANGVQLEIIARETVENEWELSVQNSLGVRSVWFELFPSAQEAIEAGLKAIETEGAEAFTDTEGFEYLLDR